MAENNKLMPAAVFGGLALSGALVAGAIFFKPSAPAAPQPATAPDGALITAAQPTAAPASALTASAPASQVAATPAPQVAEAKPTPAPQAAPARPKVAHKRVSKPAAAATPAPSDESTYSAGPIRVEQAPPPPPPVCSESEPRYMGQVAGAVGGAVLGGAVGAMGGKGQGKDALRIVGAIVGGYAGSQTVGKPIDAASMNKEQAEMSRRTGCQARTYQ